jgi:hypothetical protein
MADNYREHKGHRLELREGEHGTGLIIDGEPASYGRLPDGQYFLYEYAYDPSDNLMDLATKFVDYRDRADEVRAKLKRSEDM